VWQRVDHGRDLRRPAVHGTNLDDGVLGAQLVLVDHHDPHDYYSDDRHHRVDRVKRVDAVGVDRRLGGGEQLRIGHPGRPRDHDARRTRNGRCRYRHGRGRLRGVGHEH
jgi:hypothetical protein